MAAPTVPEVASGRAERVVVPAPPYRRRSPNWRRALRRQLLPFLLVLPALVLVGGVLGYPIGQLVATSFQQLGLFQLIGHHVLWNGLTNYRQLFSDSQFYSSLEQTAVFVLATVGLTMAIGTGVALLMGRVGKVLRTVISLTMLLVWAMPSSAASIVWTWLFQAQWGVVNYVLVALGLHSFGSHDWFASQISAYSIVTAMIVWQAIPFIALSTYAALTLVPNELHEAAAVDGATPGVIFRQVTFPIIRPVFFLLTVLSIIWDGNVFNQVWYLTGGRAQVLNVMPLGVWQYIEAFATQQYGMGAAIAIVTVLILLVVTGYYIRTMVRTGEVSA